jgi:hypothetical protein
MSGLNEGIIEEISRGNLSVNGYVQVIEISYSNEKYILSISDGIHKVKIMLTSQYYDVCMSKSLIKYSIIELQEIQINTFEKKQFLMITRMEIIQKVCEVLGSLDLLEECFFEKGNNIKCKDQRTKKVS